jgi:hypothetical protein
LQHIENKHKGKAYDDCFDYTYVAAPNLATVFKGSRYRATPTPTHAAAREVAEEERTDL